MSANDVLYAVLVAVIITLVVALVLISRNAIGSQNELAKEGIAGQRDAYPAGVLQLIALLLGGGMTLAKMTPTPLDDQGFTLLAQMFGFTVNKLPTGEYVVSIPTKPDTTAPAAAPPASG